METIAADLQAVLHELPGQELQQAGSAFDGALSHVETAQAQGVADEVMAFGGYLALARCASAEAAAAVGECGTHIANYVAANTSRATRGGVIALPVVQGPTTTEDGKRFLTDETAALIPGVIEELRPLAKTGSLRSYHEVLTEQSDAVLCELLRHNVPLADHVLLQRHIRLLYKLAGDILRNRADNGLEPEDLVARGAEVYLAAARRYMEGSTKLNSYAASSALLEMRKTANAEAHHVSIPQPVESIVSRLDTEEKRRKSQSESPMTDQEVSEFLGGMPLDRTLSVRHERTVVDVRHAQHLTLYLGHVDVNANEYYGYNSGAGTYIDSNRLQNVGRDAITEDTEELALRRVVRAQIEDVLRTLEPREAEVLRARYGFGGPVQTYAELGKKLGTSKSGVQFIERGALAKLAERHPYLASLLD